MIKKISLSLILVTLFSILVLLLGCEIDKIKKESQPPPKYSDLKNLEDSL